MKRIIITAICLLLSLFLLPLLLGGGGKQEPIILPAVPTPARSGDRSIDQEITVRVKTGQEQVVEMTMADYLWSVVAAEMPASFEPEALKAQAVTARTYTMRKIEQGEEGHPQADVCTDINCCQAFMTREQAVRFWGESASEYEAKILAAVEQTDGEIMTYQGEIIQAVFFSSAAGSTEDAVEVWGNAVPYLVGVESPEGEGVPNYHTEVVLTQEQFRQTFLEVYPQADLSGEPETWFRDMTETASGRVASLNVGGVTVKGTELRSLFSLRSASFTVKPGQDAVCFQVTGYGHGVGMSQYGANTMAAQGKTYRDILTWYYTGIEICEY